MIVYTLSDLHICYICRDVYKEQRQTVHLIIERVIIHVRSEVPTFMLCNSKHVILFFYKYTEDII